MQPIICPLTGIEHPIVQTQITCPLTSISHITKLSPEPIICPLTGIEHSVQKS